MSSSHWCRLNVQIRSEARCTHSVAEKFIWHFYSISSLFMSNPKISLAIIYTNVGRYRVWPSICRLQRYEFIVIYWIVSGHPSIWLFGMNAFAVCRMQNVRLIYAWPKMNTIRKMNLNICMEICIWKWSRTFSFWPKPKATLRHIPFRTFDKMHDKNSFNGRMQTRCGRIYSIHLHVHVLIWNDCGRGGRQRGSGTGRIIFSYSDSTGILSSDHLLSALMLAMTDGFTLKRENSYLTLRGCCWIVRSENMHQFVQLIN